MNELHFAYKVKQHLHGGTHDLKPDIAERLRQARNAAVAHQKVAATAPIMVTAGHFFHFSDLRQHLLPMLGAALILASTLGFVQWHASERVSEIAAIDSALLADDLPLEAFVDRGFEAWLNSPSAH